MSVLFWMGLRTQTGLVGISSGTYIGLPSSFWDVIRNYYRLTWPRFIDFARVLSQYRDKIRA
jgi:hypothetical protein